ncbi:hypothetical protein REC12_26505 [Desulfosporosinus sp. PR]|uniref:hypothetical protein n=1 Tax=Candidatus Desulfosporosinus nitrosoreducens TaxID=3401928 RepID=UPI0027EA2307|nr:hypothetical protein [Desulfosporosinus sp. PR]MDQ7097154.1 hypothetical protein [Desulfosporosinus sp. PR]
MDNESKLEFHHIGMPVKEERPHERYSSLYGMYTSDGSNKDIHIQFHRYDDDSILDKRIRETVHVAFKTKNIEDYLKGKEVIMPLYEPFKGYKVAMILLDGLPVEIIETTLSEKEIWEDDHSNSVLYPKEK